ncbi:hypothetical protein [Lactococcus lactis]|nr:hypothetical protein [Lactococcus lactis]
MNQFIQFVSALAVSTLTESFKAWLSDKRSSKKHKKMPLSFYTRYGNTWYFFYKKNRARQGSISGSTMMRKPIHTLSKIYHIFFFFCQTYTLEQRYISKRRSL